MLPDIKKPSGIRKTVQMSFGGIDLRPEAADGTFSKTVNMSSDKAPVMASRPKRRAVYTDEQIYGCDMIGMGGGIFANIDGVFYYNGVAMGSASAQGGGELIPFGNKIIIPWTREIVDLTYRPKGYVSAVASLPATPSEGDAYVVNQAGPESFYHMYVYESGAWTDKGPIKQSLEAELSLSGPYFMDGYYMGEKAEMNEIKIDNGQGGTDAGKDFTAYFKAGDALQISGCQIQDKNNQTLIVREVLPDRLRFYENSFANEDWYICYAETTLSARSTKYYKIEGESPYNGQAIGFDAEVPAGTAILVHQENMASQFLVSRYDPSDWSLLGQTDESEFYPPQSLSFGRLHFVRVAANEIPISHQNGVRESAGAVKISRKWPEEIQGVFADSNRLWGWVGHQIRCSKLGDPSNWEFFDGTAEDSWAVDVHDPDAFTGGISVHGYPTFFTVHKRYRIYGSEPEAYQLGEQDCEGVREGCENSLAALDGALYYVSPVGVMQDTGSAPACVSEALGLLRLTNAVAGGCRQRYYVTGLDEAGVRHNLILNTRNGLWIDEGSRRVVSYAVSRGIMHEAELTGTYFDELTIWARASGSPLGNGTEEGAISSVLETNDYTMAQPNRKRVHRVQLRFVLGSGASLAVSIQYDSSETWAPVKTIDGDGVKKSVFLPVIPRRCDHFRLRFSGSGDWELQSLALDLKQGSAMF